jgi:hypothetical protein
MLVVAALVCSALAVTPAVAKGPRPSPTRNERCLVSPNPVSSGVAQQMWVIGSGFKPNVQLSVFVGGGSILMAGTDEVGSFSTWAWAQYPAGTTGTIGVDVFYAGDRRMTVLAHCTFDVN